MAELQSVWGWQPALYLFLGGMGAGAFVVAALLYFLDRQSNRKTICIASWAATACLVAGLLLLLSELTNPLRGMLLWQSFSNGTSWMTFGAWVVFAAVIVFGLMAVLSTEQWVKPVSKKWKGYPKARNRMRSVLAVVGIALGLCVAVYTGILLMSVPGVPLWNTLLLPCLFTVSALDTGAALVEIVAVAPKRAVLSNKTHRLLEASVVVLVVLEVVVLAAFLATMQGSDLTTATGATAAASARLLAQGMLAPFFWLLVGACGLALPLAMAIAGMVLRKRRKSGRTVMLVGAAGALVGGCALRFLVLMAGLHADVVAQAVSKMVS